ncbi:hypothetical protein KC323_g103 [Hortaea werneckii]|nr:hypothetical protein KC323_g103 [Hortaea werneckii]
MLQLSVPIVFNDALLYVANGPGATECQSHGRLQSGSLAASRPRRPGFAVIVLASSIMYGLDMTRKSDGVSPCDVIQSWSEKLMAARHMEIVNIDVILVEGVVVGPMSDRGKNVRRRLSPAERRIDPRAVALTSSRRVIRGIQRRKAIGPESATTAWPQGV